MTVNSADCCISWVMVRFFLQSQHQPRHGGRRRATPFVDDLETTNVSSPAPQSTFSSTQSSWHLLSLPPSLLRFGFHAFGGARNAVLPLWEASPFAYVANPNHQHPYRHSTSFRSTFLRRMFHCLSLDSPPQGTCTSILCTCLGSFTGSGI